MIQKYLIQSVSLAPICNISTDQWRIVLNWC